MKKKVFLVEVRLLLGEFKKELNALGYCAKLIGGLKTKGYTRHDIDLDIKMPFSDPPDEEIFYIINDFGNELWKKHGLEFDLNFWFKGKPKYKLDQGGFFEYQEDGSLEAFSPF